MIAAKINLSSFYDTFCAQQKLVYHSSKIIRECLHVHSFELRVSGEMVEPSKHRNEFIK